MVVQAVQDRVKHHFYFVDLVRILFELALSHNIAKLRQFCLSFQSAGQCSGCLFHKVAIECENLSSVFLAKELSLYRIAFENYVH